MCDNHPTVLAYCRVTGETDSFGSEEADLCQACWEKYEAAAKKPIISTCDWCKKPDVAIQPTRDSSEGSCGPVYDVCKPCRQQENERLRAEFEADREEEESRDEW